jgi:hypothetical protein
MKDRAARKSRIAAAIAVAVVCAVSIAYAQQIWVGGGFRMSTKWATESDFDGRFLFCRAAYTGGWNGGWRTDYPGADINFSIRLAELTTVSVKFDERRQPNHVVVPLTDPLLYRCPVLFSSNPGNARFSPEEVLALRTFFLKGGFLWVDDFWGTSAWNNWEDEIGRVLPPAEYPIFDVPVTHPIMRTLYNVKTIPQVPNIGFWRGTRGQTSERGRDSAEVHFRGIQDSRGRLMVLMTHNTDIADTWEREGENQDYFDTFAAAGYAIGVNVMLYAMTR